jgi:hypothetical protein
MGDLDQHLASLGRRDVDLDDLQGSPALKATAARDFMGRSFLEG